MMLYLKAILGGVVGVCIVLVLIVGAKAWHAHRAAPEYGAIVGFVNLTAVLHTPWVIALLLLAFGVGLWLTLHSNPS
jgi:chromate transport protein ChrA